MKLTAQSMDFGEAEVCFLGPLCVRHGVGAALIRINTVKIATDRQI